MNHIIERMKANPKLGNIGNWQERHNAAVAGPKPGFEHAMVTMLRGWLEYADIHHTRFGTVIGEDGVLGDAWRDAGKAIHELLNGDCGRIDCGTFSAVIHDTLKANGVEEE